MLRDETWRVENAPGFQWRPARGGRIPIWVAPEGARRRGFEPATRRLSSRAFATPPTAEEREEIAALCTRLHAEVHAWSTGNRPAPRVDTVLALINLYQTHPGSKFHDITAETRRSYLANLRTLGSTLGKKRLADLRGGDILAVYAAAKKPNQPGEQPKVRAAHALMTMLRTVLAFGVVVEIDDAVRPALVMSKMEFETSRPRDVAMTHLQATAIRQKAHELGYPSIALATALMFECVLRQKDVIGEWVKDERAGGIVSLGLTWRGGILWGEHISRDLILSKPTSKSRGRKVAEHDLKVCAMVMEELQHVPLERRVGPVVICEASEADPRAKHTRRLPWRARHFRETWREIARAAGVPDAVRCMDARAGGITEGSDAGADIEHLRKAATHSNVGTTGRYNRDTLSKSRHVAEVRQLHRKK